MIARIIPTTPPEVFSSDLTWWLVDMQDWVAVEYGSGMICASLILLKPLIKLLFPRLLGGSLHESPIVPAAAWHALSKRSRSGETARQPVNPHTTVSNMPTSRHTDDLTLNDKAFSVTADSPRPCSYLKALRSPDLESSPFEDPFSRSAGPSRNSYNSDCNHPVINGPAQGKG